MVSHNPWNGFRSLWWYRGEFPPLCPAFFYATFNFLDIDWASVISLGFNFYITFIICVSPLNHQAFLYFKYFICCVLWTKHTCHAYVRYLLHIRVVCSFRNQGFGSGSVLDPYSIGPVDPDPYSESGSRSRRAKMTHKRRKNSCFEVLDGLFCDLQASSVTWTYFMEA